MILRSQKKKVLSPLLQLEGKEEVKRDQDLGINIPKTRSIRKKAVIKVVNTRKIEIRIKIKKKVKKEKNTRVKIKKKIKRKIRIRRKKEKSLKSDNPH